MQQRGRWLPSLSSSIGVAVGLAWAVFPSALFSEPIPSLACPESKHEKRGRLLACVLPHFGCEGLCVCASV